MNINQNFWQSWNGNITHPYQELYSPTTEDEIITIIKKSSKVRVFGQKKSSADIAAGNDTLIDLNEYNRILHWNDEKKQVTVQSGISLKNLLTALEDHHWCIPCLPDIDSITLGGAIATGTHGTMGKNGGEILGNYMTGGRIIQADGSVLEFDETHPMLDAFRLSVGVLGILSTVTLQCNPINLLKVEERPVRDTEWLTRYPEWLQKRDFVRILWLPHTGFGYAILGDRISADEAVTEKKAPRFIRHRRNFSQFLYRFTVKHPRFTAFANRILKKLFFSHRTVTKGTLYGATVTKSRGSTLELAEWTIGIDRFNETFLELKKELNSSHNKAFAHIPMDIRFIREDKTWLSYAYGQDTVTVGCVCRNAEYADAYEAFQLIEQIFLKNGGRPHWAKRFQARQNELSRLYPRWNDFIEFRRKMDPAGKFLNAYLSEIFE